MLGQIPAISQICTKRAIAHLLQLLVLCTCFSVFALLYFLINLQAVAEECGKSLPVWIPYIGIHVYDINEERYKVSNYHYFQS